MLQDDGADERADGPFNNKWGDQHSKRLRRLRRATQCGTAALPEVFGFDTEFGHNILHRNPLAALHKRGLTLVKAVPILLGHGFIVGRGCGQRAGDRIDHHF
jgi:hypothetical protein